MLKEITDPFGIFLICLLAFDGFDILGWVKRTLISSSRILKIGIQYLPVDSIQTSEQWWDRSQSFKRYRSEFKVEKDRWKYSCNVGLSIGDPNSSDNQVFVNIHATTVEANDFHSHKKTPFVQKERWHWLSSSESTTVDWTIISVQAQSPTYLCLRWWRQLIYIQDIQLSRIPAHLTCTVVYHLSYYGNTKNETCEI